MADSRGVRSSLSLSTQASGIQYRAQAVWEHCHSHYVILLSLTGRSTLQILLAVFITSNDNAGGSNEDLKTGISFTDLSVYENFKLRCICHAIINYLWGK
jgi:hypothetical protein